MLPYIKFQYLLLAAFCLLSFTDYAQVAGERMEVPIQRMDGTFYIAPDVGGMNNPQFSEIDFNNDGIMDLFVFDKTGDVVMTYINNGTPGEVDYEYAPEYAKAFPRSIKEWALLRDYNNDGVMDVFCYSSTLGIAGIDLYQGSYVDGELTYELVLNHHNDFDLLSFPGFSGLELEIYVSRDDLPSILDVDDDGDTDILTFNQVGNKMEWYKNLSVEMGYGVDSLYFEFVDPCWGLFIESGTSSEIILSTNPNQCADLNLSVQTGVHVGSTSVCWDNDGDGDMEMIVGDVTTNTLSYLNSSTVGDDATPWYDILDSAYPSYDTSVDLPLFPAPFVLDVDNDGRKDMLAAPNDVGASYNRRVAWRYRNYTNEGEEGEYNFRQDDFLVEDCVDLGQGTKPVFFDYNADGLKDIVVGTDGFFVNIAEFDTRLVLFENVGTATEPSYQLVDDDWLEFSQYTNRNLAPAFGDLDGDGDLDLMVGDNNGELFYLENEGGTGIPSFNTVIPNYLSINAGQKCVPALADLDGDGLTDIISGVKQGRVAFFKNIGTIGNPDFDPNLDIAPNSEGIGGIDVRYTNNGFTDTRGYASPKVFYVNGTEPHIISGSYFNDIFIYSGITGDVIADFTLDSGNYGEIFQGQETAMDMADIDNDGYFEMVIGNTRGGLAFFDTDYVSDVTLPTIETEMGVIDYKIVPNPAHEKVEIIFEGDVNENEIRVGLMDMNGRWVKPMKKGRSINIDDLPVGVFIVTFYLGEEQIVEKLIKY